MPENNLVGYKKVFGLVLPEWVDEKRLNLTLGVLVVSLVMYFISVLVIAPNKETLKKNQATLKTEQESLVKIKEAMASVEETRTAYSQADFDRVLRAMPTSYSPEEAIFGIRNIALLSGVFLDGYTLPAGVIVDNTPVSTTANAKKTNNFSQFVINLNVSGLVDNLLKFITNLESSLPVGFVSDLNIQELAKASNLKSENTVNLKLQITYYLPTVFKFTTNDIETMKESEKALIKTLSLYFDSFAVSGLETGYDAGATTPQDTNTGTIKNIFGL